jgi:hypothetical protein
MTVIRVGGHLEAPMGCILILPLDHLNSTGSDKSAAVRPELSAGTRTGDISDDADSGLQRN